MGCLVNKTPRAVAADGGSVIKPLIKYEHLNVDRASQRSRQAHN